MNLFFRILIGCIILSAFFSCTNSSEKIKSDAINFPNKSSELAQLMRDLVVNTEKIQQQISNNNSPDLSYFIHSSEELYKATPTDPDVRNDGRFKIFTENYISKVNNLINSNGDEKEQYNLMIKSCIDCHLQICPGPVKRIRKLRIN